MTGLRRHTSMGTLAPQEGPPLKKVRPLLPGHTQEACSPRLKKHARPGGAGNTGSAAALVAPPERRAASLLQVQQPAVGKSLGPRMAIDSLLRPSPEKESIQEAPSDFSLYRAPKPTTARVEGEIAAEPTTAPDHSLREMRRVFSAPDLRVPAFDEKAMPAGALALNKPPTSPNCSSRVVVYAHWFAIRMCHAELWTAIHTKLWQTSHSIQERSRAV